MKLFTFIKSFHNTHMIIISLLILIALLYFNKTHFKENIQNIDNVPNNSQQSSISLASTGVNNVVDLMNSTKQKNVTNVDYNNRIEQKEINYDDGNTLMNTYSKIYPLRKDEIQLDNTLSEYKEENAEVNGLKLQINQMDKRMSEIQTEIKTYKQVELELQEAVAKKAALDNDISNLQSELTDCNASDEITRTKIQSQETEISILDSKLKGKQETFNQTLTKERTLASQFNTLQSRMDYLNQQPCCDGELITNGWINQNGSTTVTNTGSADINNLNTMKSNVILCPGDTILIDGCSAVNNLSYQQSSGGPNGTGATDTYSRLYKDNNGSYNQVASSDDSCFNRGVQGHPYVGPYYSYTHSSNLPCTKYVITNGGYGNNTTMPRAYVTINGQPVNGCGRQ